MEITSIINRLFILVEKKHNIWENMKLILLFENFPPEFDYQKVYIWTNQNITLKKITISLVSDNIQIFRDQAIGLKIQIIAIIAKIKQGQLKLAIVYKNKAILTTSIKDIKYWKCYKKNHFKNHCLKKK